MSTCREAHDAHVLWVDIPLFGMPAHRLHGLFGIADGHLEVAVGHAILQYDERNALIVEEPLPVSALVLHGQMAVGTAWAAHNRPSCRLLLVGQKHRQFGLVLSVAAVVGCPIGPQTNYLLGRSQTRCHKHQ